MKTPTTNFCKLLTASAIGALALTACGDDVTKTTVNETTGIEQLAAGEEFPECTAENAGDMLFAADSGKVYYCADGEWSTLNGEDGKDGAAGASCTAEPLADSSGYTVICDGDTVGTLKNGTNGTNGKDGESCTATVAKNGFDLTCGGVTVGAITNGTNGENGESCTVAEAGTDGSYEITCGKTTVTVKDGVKGADGTSCELTDNADGTVTVTCGENSATLYKAFCGTTAYDPSTQVCTDGKLYSLCGDNSYDPAKQICSDGSVLDIKEVTTAALNAEKLESGAYGTFIDTRDGQLYRTIEIGSQVWMAQNLNYATSENSYCYDNESSNCETYGRLYTWAAANEACPEGFHLPTEAEFNTLIEKVDGSNFAGTALKSTTGWNSEGNGTDAYGFSALPAGGRYDGSFDGAGNVALFWSATERKEYYARYLGLYSDDEYANLYSYDKYRAFSVRCLKD